MSIEKMKKSFQKKSYFVELFSKMAIMVVVILLIFTILSYFFISDFTKSIIYSSNERTISQVGYNMEYNREIFLNFAASLTTNNNVVQIVYDDNLSLAQVSNRMSAIYDYFSINPLIYSINIYRSSTDSWYKIGKQFTISQADNLMSKDINNAINKKGNSANFPIARKVPINNVELEKKQNLYSYVIQQSFISSGPDKNLIVLDINATDFFKTLFTGENKNSYGKISIIDSNGIMIGNENQDAFLMDVSNEPYVKIILANAGQSGNFEQIVDNKKVVITYKYLPNFDWTVISMTPFSDTEKVLGQVQIILFLICLFLLVLSIGISYMVSKKLYHPIGLLWNKMKKSEGTFGSRGKTNEFAGIDESINLMNTEIRNLQELQSKYASQMSNEVLKKLLRPHTDDKALFAEIKNAKLKIDLEKEMMILLIKIDNFSQYCDKNNEMDRYLYKYGLQNIANEIISEQFNCEFIDKSADTLVALLNIDLSIEIDDTIDKMVTAMTGIQNALLTHFDISLSAFISREAQNYKDLIDIYDEVEGISNYRILYGHKCILSVYQVENRITDSPQITNEKILHLLDMIKLSKIDRVEECYKEISASLRRSDYNSLQGVVAFLLASVFNTLSILHEKSKLIFDVDYITYNTKISSLETLDQIDIEFIDLFKKIVDVINNSKTGKVDEMVANIIRYIDEHYMDENLSSKSIVDIVDFSPRYTAKMFLEKQLKSIQQHIVDVRLEKARELLVTTDLSIESILDKIGWLNTKYFYNIFKQRYAITPTQYRFQSRQNENENS